MSQKFGEVSKLWETNDNVQLVPKKIHSVLTTNIKCHGTGLINSVPGIQIPNLVAVLHALIRIAVIAKQIGEHCKTNLTQKKNTKDAVKRVYR